MERHHSTLELVKHDETARAPERDWDATAFELDTSASAPQVVLDTSPQVVYSKSLPEVHENIENSTKERAPSHHIPKPGFKWLLMIIASAIAVAIAIGVGIGIWRHHEHGSPSPPAPGPTAPQKSSPNSTNTAQYILNDTSLAALVLSDGERHFFFQDNSGFIRRAMRSTENIWTISPSLNLSSSPKNHTPLAATVYDADETADVTHFGDGDGGPVVIGLHYVSESHILVSDSLDGGEYWTPDTEFGTWSTAVDTRSLSFCLLPRTRTANDSILNLALLFYENSTGQVSALLQRSQGEEQTVQWVDVTSQESRSLPDEFRNVPGFKQHGPNGDGGYNSTTLYESEPNATLRAPFTSAANFSESPSVGSIAALFYSPNGRYMEPFVVKDYDIGTRSPGIFGEAYISFEGYSNEGGLYKHVNQSDIATFGASSYIWINRTQPVISVSYGPPKGPFPFARLASVRIQPMTYLYHQINGTTFAEEPWDDLSATWGTTEYINVSDLSAQDSS